MFVYLMSYLHLSGKQSSTFDDERDTSVVILHIFFLFCRCQEDSGPRPTGSARFDVDCSGGWNHLPIHGRRFTAGQCKLLALYP